MRRTISIIFVGCIMMAYALPALAWGQKGHRIIAQIAYDHLDKKAKKQVNRILGEGGMIYWVNWPDEIKSDTIFPNSHDWHYQNFEDGVSVGGNLFRALDSLENVLRVNVQGTKDKEYTLRFLIHLKGDEYCPMHMARKSDRGGNKVKMKWFGTETNLHAVWDERLVDSQGYSYTEYAEMLEKRFGRKDRLQALMAEDEEVLVTRTKELTEQIYTYQESWDGNTYHYIYAMKGHMESQLYIAGIRLAMLLNSIFK